MLLFRSLTTGLLGACLLLLVKLQPSPVATATRSSAPVVQAAVAPTRRPMPSATIVDVSPAIQMTELAGLIQLAPDEHVVAIDDRPIANDLAAGTVIGGGGLVSGNYLDLTVSSATSSRRVLVLMH